MCFSDRKYRISSASYQHETAATAVCDGPKVCMMVLFTQVSVISSSLR